MAVAEICLTCSSLDGDIGSMTLWHRSEIRAGQVRIPQVRAQEIRPQARVLATDRGISCLVLDYDALRGIDDPSLRLF